MIQKRFCQKQEHRHPRQDGFYLGVVPITIWSLTGIPFLTSRKHNSQTTITTPHPGSIRLQLLRLDPKAQCQYNLQKGGKRFLPLSRVVLHARGHWFKSNTAHAEVAEWQTRCVQGAMPERVWEFKSPLRHQICERARFYFGLERRL
jgi:hypothetical protein